MKKNKKSLKKLTLNKNVISNLENDQVAGGAVATGLACPIILTRFNCPILTLACPDTLICPIRTFHDCPILTTDCSLAGCPSDFIC